ncbi:hypothetical protein SpCBS45565_g04136 [Spizellomyces sp. 'palustris']|nr:hypothetical protein SpCBS45565_g04136 [Spizellomyces sp. 'palustris']
MNVPMCASNALRASAESMIFNVISVPDMQFISLIIVRIVENRSLGQMGCDDI